jgi:hypothetical protein
MTFRPPGAAPISIAVEEGVEPPKPRPAEVEEPSKGGGSKMALLVLGILALAAVGVATGWFLTQ